MSRLSLFVSIFFECCISENKFSPFWVYSQWNKLNSFINIVNILIFSCIIQSSKKSRNRSLTTLHYFSYLCAPKSIKFFLYMRNNLNLHYYISASYIYIPYYHNISTNWED